jgi:hypothetical protein
VGEKTVRRVKHEACFQEPHPWGRSLGLLPLVAGLVPAMCKERLVSSRLSVRSPPLSGNTIQLGNYLQPLFPSAEPRPITSPAQCFPPDESVYVADPFWAATLPNKPNATNRTATMKRTFFMVTSYTRKALPSGSSPADNLILASWWGGPR